MPDKKNSGQFTYEYELLSIADKTTPSLINCSVDGCIKGSVN